MEPAELSSMQAAAKAKWIYRFSNSLVDSVKDSRATLGGKGAALAEMSRLGIPVPPGFTISAEVCSSGATEGELPETLRGELEQAVTWLESHTGKPFGATQGMPLLVSVRSGAAVSMPGMMDTILNLGLNATTVKLLAKLTGNACFAYEIPVVVRDISVLQALHRRAAVLSRRSQHAT